MLGDLEAIVNASGHYSVNDGQDRSRYTCRFQVGGTSEHTS